MKRVLNVGGGSKAIPLPLIYDGWEQLLLDIDPAGLPDIVCDARELSRLPGGEYDAVYCCHNLEHYYRHEVPRVLAGFQHVLRDNGLVHIIVPDILEVIHQTLERKLDLEDVLYTAPVGPIKVLDVLYGYSVEIEGSGQDYYAHKTGFSEKSLLRVVHAAGFKCVYSATQNLNILVVGFKMEPDDEQKAIFALEST